MDNSTLAVIFAGATFAMLIGQRIFGGGWNLSKNLQAVEARLMSEIKESRAEIEGRQETVAHDFGETVAALKEHVRQVEFHIRDNYIRKDDFVVHMKQHDDLLRVNFASLNSRLERIEKHLDSK
jgi:hypothetical protein